MSSHTRGRRTVPDILAQPARCTQRDDQVGEAHALACGYPTALRWGYHGVRLPRAAHKAHPSPGRRRRTQVRLASPAERWGGFGTCVQSKDTGQCPSPTPRARPNTTDSDNGVASRNTARCSPGVTSPPWATSKMPAPPTGTHKPSKVQQRQLQANAPHGAQAPTRTCCSSTDQAPALASRLGFIYPKSPPTNRATPAPATPTQMTANWSTIAPSTYSPCPTGPSMDVSLPTRIQPLSNTTGASQQDKKPVSNRTSQALGGTCHSPLAKTYATATWIGSRHPTRSPYHGPPPQDGRTGMITHTNRALPDLPFLTDQVCRKADSDGTHPAGPVTSQACRSSRTRLSTARTPPAGRGRMVPFR